MLQTSFRHILVLAENEGQDTPLFQGTGTNNIVYVAILCTDELEYYRSMLFSSS